MCTSAPIPVVLLPSLIKKHGKKKKKKKKKKNGRKEWTAKVPKTKGTTNFYTGPHPVAFSAFFSLYWGLIARIGVIKDKDVFWWKLLPPPTFPKTKQPRKKKMGKSLGGPKKKKIKLQNNFFIASPCPPFSNLGKKLVSGPPI
eukprot:FR737005.1.p2 GENE.FR737005.1~~FR737005.1.p2  ORF type:complete len:143 (+),score=76.72 FR737005.1:845-1273(+)